MPLSLNCCWYYPRVCVMFCKANLIMLQCSLISGCREKHHDKALYNFIVVVKQFATDFLLVWNLRYVCKFTSKILHLICPPCFVSPREESVILHFPKLKATLRELWERMNFTIKFDLVGPPAIWSYCLACEGHLPRLVLDFDVLDFLCVWRSMFKISSVLRKYRHTNM